MIFAALSDHSVASVLIVLGLIGLAVRNTIKAFHKFDEDGAIKTAARNKVVDVLKRPWWKR